MADNIFGLGLLIIDAALKKGILIKQKEEFVSVPGHLSLVYHDQLQRYCFVFGTNAENAGFVLLEDYNKLWKLK